MGTQWGASGSPARFLTRSFEKSELTHYQIRNYVRSYASYLNINSNDENPAASYNTRVEHMEKRINEAGQEQGWRLWLRSLKPMQNSTYRATWWTEVCLPLLRRFC